MKRALAIILALTLPAVALAGNNVITNYFAGYKYVPGTFTNAGDTGLSTNDAYLCFPLSILSANVSATQAAHATGDVRAVVYAIAQEFYESRAVTTNPTATTITRGETYAASGSNVNETVTHILKTLRRFGSSTLP